MLLHYKDKVLTGHENVLNILSNTGFQSTIFEGPTGIGKTTLAEIYVNALLDHMNINIPLTRAAIFQEVNGHNADTSFIKNFLKSNSPKVFPKKILLINEFQYLTRKQQQLFLEPLETGYLILIATTTERAKQFCYPAILSRCRVLQMDKPSDSEVLEYASTLIPEGARFEDDVLESLIHNCNGDIRSVIRTMLDVLSAANNEQGKCVVTSDIYHNVTGHKFVSKATTESLKSAVQKSIRGSDANAACLYALEMLDNGDLEILVRRLRVTLSEDIGLADINAVAMVNGCLDNALHLGMPEATLPITQAVMYMAMAPKSNLVARTVEKYDEISKKSLMIPPKHIASEYAEGYQYPHNSPHHIVNQRYLPNDIHEDICPIFGTADLCGDELDLVSDYWKRVQTYSLIAYPDRSNP